MRSMIGNRLDDGVGYTYALCDFFAKKMVRLTSPTRHPKRPNSQKEALATAV